MQYNIAFGYTGSGKENILDGQPHVSCLLVITTVNNRKQIHVYQPKQNIKQP